MLQIVDTSKCAFLFIDLQPLFTDRFNGTEFVTLTEQALAFARSVTIADKIIHLRANYENSKMIAFSYILNPTLPVPNDSTATSWAVETTNEIVITKKTINGFHDTNLEEYLHGQGVDTIICCGLLTCCCVHETAIGGLVRGFRPVLVEDACVDKNKEKHDATIALYKDYLYQTCKLSDLKTRFAVAV